MGVHGVLPGHPALIKETKMTTIKALSLSAALLFAGMTLATSAGAFTIPTGNSAAPVATSSDIQPVSMKKKWYYNKNRHRDSHHHYFHNGYWYASPFWLLAVPLMLNNHNDYRYYDNRDEYRYYDGY